MTTVVPIETRNTVLVQETGTVVVVTNSVVNSSGSVDLTNYYTKTEADTLLAGKANLVHQHVVNDITDFTTSLINGGSF